MDRLLMTLMSLSNPLSSERYIPSRSKPITHRPVPRNYKIPSNININYNLRSGTEYDSVH